MQPLHPITWRLRSTRNANFATSRTARRAVSSAGRPSGATVGRPSGTRVGGVGEPFAETIDTPFDRLHQPAELAVLVLTLQSPGCPPQALVAACGLAERTVARWLVGAGRHCHWVHAPLVEQG